MYPREGRTNFGVRNRTRATVDSAISTKYGLDDYNNPYVNCRFAPYVNTGAKAAIPDGNGRHVIVRDYKTVYDLVTTATGGEMRVAPIFPYPVGFWSTDGTMSVNGTAIGAYTAIGSYDGTTFRLPVATVMTNNLAAAGLGQTTDTRAVARARLITVGYRMFYTGSASNASGLIQADEYSMSLEQSDLVNANAIEILGRGGVANYNQFAGGVGQLTYDTQGFGQTTQTSDTITLRPEEGIKGVLRKVVSHANHSFQPWYDNGIALINATAIETAPTSIFTVGTIPAGMVYGSSSYPGALVVDPAFAETNIKIIGAGSYRLEIFLCMEQDLDQNHSMIDMAKPSPRLDLPLLQLVDMMDTVSTPAGLVEKVVELNKLLPANMRQRVRRRARTQPIRRVIQTVRPRRRVNNARITSGAPTRRARRGRRATGQSRARRYTTG